jgi:class 3 adenylate cyclase/tetratricopeptide (TPR) repeat protein
MMNVADWLRKLGLGQYEAAFRENSVTGDLLPDLTPEDLKDLGITLIGHRRRLLNAIAALRPGADLAGNPQAASAEHLRPSQQSTAERRQLSVMFCDLIGSTPLSSRLDPEELSAVIRGYQARVRTTMARFGGFIARYVGDGVLIYFGWPEAHEANAEKAVRAALAVIDAIAQGPVLTEPLQVRIGIATGLVVVGEPIETDEGSQQTAIGETPNLAARLQGLAGPNGIVIDAATRQQIGGFFKFRDLGTIALKGLPNPMPAWEVLEETAVESRFEALHAGMMTPLVGRQEELELLQRRWVRATSGEGQVVLLSGEPGIGKSRLVESLLERIMGERHTRVRCFCSPHHQDSALHPSIAQLGRAAAFRRDDTVEQRLDKLELLLAQATDKLEESAPLIAELLSIPSGERYPPLQLTPQIRKEKTLRALLAQLEGLATHEPVLLLFEDVHWSDPTSIELLDLIVDRAVSFRLLLIVTFRTEFAAPWTGRPHVSLLSLNRLPPREQGAIIAGVTGGKALPREVAEQIIDRADGVPLFVEELTKAVIESGKLADLGDRYVAVDPLPSMAIPTTLHASLLARLDRMAPAREVAEIGAALGRHFSHELISAVAAMSQPQLDGALAQLVGAELVYRRGIPPDAEYTFKHALVQDAAYQSMLKSRRAQLHARIADVLERSFPERAETEPETLARHLTAAALAERAIPYWLAAGRRAYERSALKEAIVQLNAGIRLLGEVQNETARMELELGLQCALGLACGAAKGYAAPEVGAAFSHAHELCLRTGKRAELGPVVRGLAWFYRICGNLSAAKALVLQLLENADAASDDELLMVMHGLLGSLLENMNERSEAKMHFEIADRLRNPQRQLSAAFRYGDDVVSICRSYHAHNLAYQGRVDTALAVAQDVVALARGAGYSLAITNVLADAAECSVILRDPAGAASFAEEAMARARDHGFASWERRAKSIIGWASALQAGASVGVSELREAVASARSAGEERIVTGMLRLLSEAELATGNPDAAAEAVSEALRLGERINLYRIVGRLLCTRGDAMVALGDRTQAEADYHRAWAWSREHNDEWDELNAALRLARLWQADGRTGNARDLLAPVYGWFTEGFDNPVLRDAKALLEKLNVAIDSATFSDRPADPRAS